MSSDTQALIAATMKGSLMTLSPRRGAGREGRCLSRHGSFVKDILMFPIGFATDGEPGPVHDELTGLHHDRDLVHGELTALRHHVNRSLDSGSFQA